MRYFVAVAEDLSFTKAAQKLRLAQPSLTRQVRNLEDEIGVRLLDRGNNRVTLTEEGRRFLFDSKKLLAMCAENVAAVQRMNRGESTQLNIGSPPLRRESTIAWHADNPSEPLKDYIQIVRDLSHGA